MGKSKSTITKSFTTPLIDSGHKFFIEYADWNRLLDYACVANQNHSSEISGMMVLKQNEESNYQMLYPAILKQVVSSGHTEIDKTELVKYYSRAIKKHGADIKFVWWHSHCNMTAFMSFVDETSIQQYSNGDWSLSLVVNVKGEYQLRFQMFKPINTGINVNLDIINCPVDVVRKSIVAEVKKKLQKKEFTTAVVPYQGEKFDPEGYQAYLDRQRGKSEDSGSDLFTNKIESAVDLALIKELGAKFEERVTPFVALLLAKYVSGEINYKKLNWALFDLDTFAAYFNIIVDTPDRETLESILKQNKNPASVIVFKLEDSDPEKNWE